MQTVRHLLMASHLDAVVLCNKCQANMAEIFQESGEFCLCCWQDRTYPNP
jgi:hypothetical protein